MEIKTILFATDYSEISDRALKVATTLARALDAMLLIVHVAEYAEPRKGDPIEAPPPREQSELAKVVPTEPGIRCRHRLLHFRPPGAAGVIVDAARDAHADMIVLGTHGRSGLSHFLAGSVAEEVIREAPCPVVTVKKPPEGHSGPAKDTQE